MDYRHRNYYLVKLDPFARDMRVRYFKLASPSLKIHPPYYHIKYNKYPQDKIDGWYWQMMLSCKIEDSDALEYELQKANRRDDFGSRFFKLNKEICGQ
jgi:hypothetical protein